MNTGLRYFDLNINIHNNKKAIQISMIPIEEISCLRSYFSQCHIQCFASKEKKDKNSKNQTHENEANNTNENKNTSNNNNDNNNNETNVDKSNKTLNEDNMSSDDSAFDIDEESTSTQTDSDGNDLEEDWKAESSNNEKAKLHLRSRIIDRNDCNRDTEKQNNNGK